MKYSTEDAIENQLMRLFNRFMPLISFLVAGLPARQISPGFTWGGLTPLPNPPHSQPASRLPFYWLFDRVPIMAR